MKSGSVYDQMTCSERRVADYLKSLGITWSYEHPVFVWDEQSRPRVWTPDFYLNQFGIYIEVCGSHLFDYQYRRRIYQKNGHLVIFLHLYKHSERWIYHFSDYLHFF